MEIGIMLAIGGSIAVFQVLLKLVFTALEVERGE